jgi:MFS family permease
MGTVMGLGEILGGVFGPSLAGSLSDTYGLPAPCWLLAALAVLGTVAALFLRETAPRIVARRAAIEGVTA